MIRNFRFILISIALLISLAGFQVSAQYRTETFFLEHDGLERSYEVFVPENYRMNKAYPLIFILHGGGGTGKGLVRTTRVRFNKLASQNNFIAVYPNGYGKSWNDGGRDTLGLARKMEIDDVGFFQKMIKKVSADFSINNKAIFACGISNGGFMAQRLAFELSGKIRGIGVVAANLSCVQSEEPFPKNPVPVIFINGTHDPLVPYHGGYVTVFKQKRGKVLSMERSLETWKKINACVVKASETKIPDKIKRDNCSAEKTVWANPENQNIKVVEIKVNNGGHTWPGTRQYLPKSLIGNTNRDFNGCDEIWLFFESLM